MIGSRAAAAFVTFVILFVVSVAGYVALTWIFMRGHTERRGFGRSLRSAFREFSYSLVISALRPLFFLFRRHYSGGEGGVPIVLVHGYMGAHIDFVRMVKVLTHRKVGRIYGFNYPWMMSIESCAERLGRFVEWVRTENNAAKIDLVCHSLGGVVALHYLATGGDRSIRRCATIASPHAGVAWQGPMPSGSSRQLKSGSSYLLTRQASAVAAECLSVFSSHDNIVHPPTTSSLTKRGGRDLLVRDLGHLEILFDRDVIDEVATFLERPEPPQDAHHFPQNKPVKLTKNAL